jgi:CBS domain-containing protein
MRASDVMTKPVITVTPDTTVKVAAKLLATNGFTALPVLDEDDRLIGMVTEADLVRDRFPRDARYRYLGSGERAPGTTVGAVMTSPAIGMGTESDVTDLVAAMWEDRVRSMPIVDGSTVVGIVTRRDLVRVLARDDAEIAVDVRNRLEHYAGGPSRWSVRVRDGVVDIEDAHDDPADRHVALVLAEGVRGVTRVRVTH